MVSLWHHWLPQEGGRACLLLTPTTEGEDDQLECERRPLNRRAPSASGRPGAPRTRSRQAARPRSIPLPALRADPDHGAHRHRRTVIMSPSAPVSARCLNVTPSVSVSARVRSASLSMPGSLVSYSLSPCSSGSRGEALASAPRLRLGLRDGAGSAAGSAVPSMTFAASPDRRAK